MRKLVFGINLTLDGCCDHTKGIGDEEVHIFFTQLSLDADTFVYGRKTYELMVPFWPEIAKDNSGHTKAMNDFAHAFTSVKQIVVFSRSLSGLGEKNAKVVHGDLREEILKLKQQDGKNILTGGVDIPSQLIQLGLVDEYYFVIQPLVVGKGRRLLESFTLQEKLQFVEAKIMKSGCVALRYVKSSS
ncbi:MAG TPA: dihydrofolate reductase family protein [Chryseolinea sp.]|nr:dihydrofolate reductase family protein [Chryseolinea sp.]